MPYKEPETLHTNKETADDFNILRRAYGLTVTEMLYQLLLLAKEKMELNGTKI